VELLGGLAVLVELLIPLVSVPMAIVLLVAIFTAHLPNGFSSIKLLSVTAAGTQFGQPGYDRTYSILPGSQRWWLRSINCGYGHAAVS
jgi:putative oxidoreductase